MDYSSAASTIPLQDIATEREQLGQLFEENGITSGSHQCNAVRAAPQTPLNRYLDHTILKAESTFQQIEQHCREALELNVRSVCIPPNRLRQARPILFGSSVTLGSVVGFPYGYAPTSAKVTESGYLLENGCEEFDMVIQIGALIDDDLLALYQDIAAVTQAVAGKMVKVILETAYLTPKQIIRGSLVAIWAGAAMLKTSTGFAHQGATLEHIALLRAIAGEEVGVKAAGGIRDRQFAQQCIAAGADRLGASRSSAILAQGHHE